MQLYRHKRGNTFTSRIALRKAPEGTLVDLSGFTIRQHIRHARTRDLLVKLEDWPDQKYAAVKDMVAFLVPAAITADWEPNTYYSDIKVIDPDGTEVSSVTITLVIEEEITQ